MCNGCSNENFRIIASVGFHLKEDNERFTAMGSRCCQDLKFENVTSLFDILLRIFKDLKMNTARAARLFFPQSTNHVIDLWRCRCFLKPLIASAHLSLGSLCFTRCFFSADARIQVRVSSSCLQSWALYSAQSALGCPRYNKLLLKYTGILSCSIFLLRSFS